MEKGSLVPLTQEGLTEYLDACVRSWRQRRDSAESAAERDMAAYYVDAFQSMRISVLGSLLPP